MKLLWCYIGIMSILLFVVMGWDKLSAMREKRRVPEATLFLLAVIGGNMIREALGKEEEEVDDSFAFRTMLTLAIATSIDALAVGVTLRLQGADILLAAPMIAVTTGVLSPIGLKVGNVFGARYKSKAELAGGVVLVALGIKFLLEGLGVL